MFIASGMFKLCDPIPKSNLSFRHFAFYKDVIPLASILKIVSLASK